MELNREALRTVGKGSTGREREREREREKERERERGGETVFRNCLNLFISRIELDP